MPLRYSPSLHSSIVIADLIRNQSLPEQASPYLYLQKATGCRSSP